MISVIIPVYNVEKYIARCLDSVVNQTYRDLEIIVVNDATPDNSMAIVDRYAVVDKRIRIVSNPRNMGLMLTRKNGYKVAKGDYLTFVDSDDYLPINSIETMIAKAQEGEIDLVAGTMRYEKIDGGKELWKCKLPFGGNTIDLYRALLTRNFTHNLCGKLFKSALLQQFSYISFDKMTNAEDACLFYQVIANCKHVATLDDIIYCYCQNVDSSMNKQFSLEQIQNIIQFNKLLHTLKGKYPSLQKDFNHNITDSIIRLFLHGYPISQVHGMVKSAKLDEYTRIHNIVRAFTLHEILYYVKLGLSQKVLK